MTNEEENTARELIASAFADLGRDADKVNTHADLARFVAKSLRDETEFYNCLKDANEAALLSIVVHDHGTSQHNEKMNLGSLQIEVLAKVRHDNSPLLGNLANPHNYYGYALALVSERDGDTALVLVMATRDRQQLFAIAVDDADKTNEAWHYDGSEKVPDDLAATIAALSEAVAR